MGWGVPFWKERGWGAGGVLWEDCPPGLDKNRSLGNGVRKNGVRNRCPYRRCGVDTEFPYRLSLSFSAVVSQLRPSCPIGFGGTGVDTEFPYRVPIVDRVTIAVPLFDAPHF